MPAPTWRAERENERGARFHDSFGKKFRAALPPLRANTTQSIIIIILAHADRPACTRAALAFFHADCCNLRLFSTTFNLYTPNLAPAASETTHSIALSAAALWNKMRAALVCSAGLWDWEFIYFLRADADVLIYFKRMNAAKNVTLKWALHAVISRHS